MGAFKDFVKGILLKEEHNKNIKDIKNLKPSELPNATVIGNYSDGLWFKDDQIWVAIAPRGIKTRVHDLGYSDVDYGIEFVIEKADEYFKDYDVVSLPVGWAPTHREEKK